MIYSKDNSSTLSYGFISILCVLISNSVSAQTCVSDGGNKICSAPIPSAWVVGGSCDTLSRFSHVIRARCIGAGGTFNGVYGSPQCLNPEKPDDFNLARHAQRMDKQLYGAENCNNVTDSGWGAAGIPPGGCNQNNFSSPGYVNGILVTDYRVINTGCLAHYARRSRELRCPEGTRGTTIEGKYFCIEQRAADFSDCGVGNPILPLSGKKIQRETDFATNRVPLIRFYSSKPSRIPYNADLIPQYIGQFGFHWRTQFDYRLYRLVATDVAYAISFPSGALQYFREDFTPLGHMYGNGGLRQQEDHFIYEDGSLKLIFSDNGLLQQYRPSSGTLLSLHYSDNNTMPVYTVNPDQTPNVNVLSNNLLTHITLPNNETLYRFFYDPSTRISAVTNGSDTTTYYYNTNGSLVKVTQPDGQIRQYRYTGKSKYNRFLSEITDENGNLQAKWTYNLSATTPVALSSEHANGTDKVTLEYYGSRGGVLSPVVTNSLGKKTTYDGVIINGVSKITKVEGHPSANCAGANQAYTYDTNGFMASKTVQEPKPVAPRNRERLPLNGMRNLICQLKLLSPNVKR